MRNSATIRIKTMCPDSAVPLRTTVTAATVAAVTYLA